jgi:hypothetical protein
MEARSVDMVASESPAGHVGGDDEDELAAGVAGLASALGLA